MRGKDRKGRQWLIFGGSLSISIALLHVVIALMGMPGVYRFFGAGEQMANWEAEGSVLPALITLGIAGVFVAWALYAFSGAGVLPRLPLLRWALLGIAAVYTLRGLMFFPEVWLLLRIARIIEAQHPMFSLVSLCAGIVHIVGIVGRWPRLSLLKETAQADKPE